MLFILQHKLGVRQVRNHHATIRWRVGSDSFVAQIQDPEAPGKGAVFPRWKGGEAIKTDDYSMTLWFDGSGKARGSMLFDHRVDRDETRNLAGDPAYREIALELQERVDELKATR